MNIFEGLRIGCSWRVVATRPLTPWEYLCATSAKVVQSQFGYSVDFTLKSNKHTHIPLSTKCYTDNVVGTIIDLHDITIVILEMDRQNITRVEF